jgi:hypothetical protein
MKTFFNAVVIAFALCLFAIILSGCSATSALTGLASKPEVTAQAGAENVKQTVGLTAKQDESTKQETTIKDSKVDRVDTSSRKQIKTSAIQANEIKADSFQVIQSDGYGFELAVHIFVILCFYVGGFLTGRLTNKKEA